ncbi:MAG: MmgE/PrpD family protein, partial [Betaproteobacteria bacterium]
MKPLEQLSRFAAGVRYTELPDEVRDQAGWILLDSIGAIVGGSAEPEMRSLSDKLAGDGMWLGRGDCAVL